LVLTRSFPIYVFPSLRVCCRARESIEER
jgi:hypothetical protein